MLWVARELAHSIGLFGIVSVVTTVGYASLASVSMSKSDEPFEFGGVVAVVVAGRLPGHADSGRSAQKTARGKPVLRRVIGTGLGLFDLCGYGCQSWISRCKGDRGVCVAIRLTGLAAFELDAPLGCIVGVHCSRLGVHRGRERRVACGPFGITRPRQCALGEWRCAGTRWLRRANERQLRASVKSQSRNALILGLSAVCSTHTRW